MATIGNSPRYANYAPEYFTGNSVQVAFNTLYNIASAASILVIIDGIKQLANTYSVNGNTVTFSEAPPNLSTIEIINLAAAGQVNTVADNTVSTSKLVDANVTLEKMAPNSVGNTNLVDSSVSTKKLNFDTGSFSFRNKIIGGDFSTNPWQRGTAFAAVASGTYTADRWAIQHVMDGVVSIFKANDGPLVSQVGQFTQCFHIDVTTADTSIAAGQYLVARHSIEGLNATNFGFGQSGTRYATLSFWHKHTKTGIHCVAFQNSANNRSYVAEYVQDVSDTWEMAQITIPVDTTGTWLYDNGIGLTLYFAMACGSTFQTTANTWTAGNFFTTANQVNGLDNVNNNFKIALVQLELGEVATPFESSSVGQVLFLCQRYYEVRNTDVKSANIHAGHTFKVPKRATPTLTHIISGGSFTESPQVSVDGFYAIYNVTTNYSWTASAEL
jgi:hypothetical protein